MVMVLGDVDLNLGSHHSREKVHVRRTTGRNLRYMNNFVVISFGETVKRPCKCGRQVLVDLRLQAGVTRDSNSTALRTADGGMS